MKVIYGLGKTKLRFSNPIVAIGIFDGLHRGHQILIKKLVNRVRKVHGQSIVLTFYPHPVHVLHPEVYLPYIISLTHRLKLLEEMGVDVCIVEKFTKSFSKLTPDEFVVKYLVKKIGVKEIFVGDDFRFGARREGNSIVFNEMASRYGFVFHAVHPIKATKGKVSSTDIRKLIEEGRLKDAEKFLGRPVGLLGKVERGDSRGKSIGFPTANIYADNEVFPPRGVYAVYVEINHKRYKGMANVGFAPTFHKQSRRMHVEVNIFDWNQNLYGKEILIEFIKKIRDEKIFPSVDQLIEQLQKDKKVSNKVLKN